MTYFGAHIKKQSTLLKTLKQLHSFDGNALQLFASNPRSCQLPNIDSYKSIAKEVKEYCKIHDIALVVHASYTINLAKEPKNGKRMMPLGDCYWIDLIIHELIIADMLGAVGVVVHVGKFTTDTKENGMKNMYNAFKYIIEYLSLNKMKSRLILETPAGVGTELLQTIHEFIAFFNSFSMEDKDHIGICVDTAHIWSAGYDINEYYDILSEINEDDIVVVHFNNSKKDKGSHVDQHENIFDGNIDINDMRTFIEKIKSPIVILESPSDDIEKDFEWLRS